MTWGWAALAALLSFTVASVLLMLETNRRQAARWMVLVIMSSGALTISAFGYATDLLANYA